MIPSRHKKLSEIECMKDYTNYAIDIEGNVWSLNYRWPKKLSPGMSAGYKYVLIRDKHKNKKVFYIHRLVCLAFIPTDNPTRKILHKDGNKCNNKLENLEWIVRLEDKLESNDFILHSSLVERIQKVHMAAQLKGLRVSDSYSFTTEMVENAIDAYIMQYGLRKVMPNL